MLSTRLLPKPDDLGPDPEPVGARFDLILRTVELDEPLADVHELPVDRAELERPAATAA